MDYAKRLTGGVGAWLNFEAACDRTALFSEKYLAHPIGQILNAASGGRTLAEYQHPVLGPLKTSAGRRPEVDFVVINEKREVVVAVESKWIGATTPPVDKIFWDLIRLEMLASQGIRAIFVLGGKRRKLETFFAHPAFAATDNRGVKSPLLRHDNNALHQTTLGPTVEARRAMLRNLFAGYQDFEFPNALQSRRTAPFPSDPKSSIFQVYAWEITSLPKRGSFRPKNSAQYRQFSSTTDPRAVSA
ncbi:hypothetical protein ASE17_19365 [Phenylobacterium sp. Root77]|uniref:hypothetical protein n=1 Tax=unclassified Phenylobacterium TaxID=2640670 RepID=UPI0006F2645E|nr:MULTISPECIES: hypothetical protein [unclassified Phenylobacterium]KQW65502.1 hypothetical protein ASC73_20155 [Phenylobacterium sp. Root1277]KQW94187.1 hypothetical protein ASC79_00015 [Phenylobacterium sp. Root1290]KRC39011.1 hypothetical protein ASE17_19365 [Phenylobacterium sp. Root77]